MSNALRQLKKSMGILVKSGSRIPWGEEEEINDADPELPILGKVYHGRRVTGYTSSDAAGQRYVVWWELEDMDNRPPGKARRGVMSLHAWDDWNEHRDNIHNQ